MGDITVHLIGGCRPGHSITVAAYQPYVTVPELVQMPDWTSETGGAVELVSETTYEIHPMTFNDNNPSIVIYFGVPVGTSLGTAIHEMWSSYMLHHYPMPGKAR